MNRFFLIFISLIFTGCATFTGDDLISLTHLPPRPERQENLLKVEEMVTKLYMELALPEKRKIPIDRISTYELIQENKDIRRSHEELAVFLINGDIHISHCRNSIVVATGNIDISHGAENILISGKNIQVSHDRGKSLIVAKGKVDISFAVNTSVYAPGGLKISHPTNVIAYNTEERKVSWGHVNNILIPPLFKFEK